MNRRRVNILTNQIKDTFTSAPPQTRVNLSKNYHNVIFLPKQIDFLRENDKVFEAESNELIQTLSTFQHEFGQIISIFENTNATNLSKSELPFNQS